MEELKKVHFRPLINGNFVLDAYDRLDELIKEDVAVKKKIIADNSAKKWHILVIVYLLAIVAYIFYFAVYYRILMIGFFIATLTP